MFSSKDKKSLVDTVPAPSTAPICLRFKIIKKNAAADYNQLITSCIALDIFLFTGHGRLG